jgi:hypothetical protein
VERSQLKLQISPTFSQRLDQAALKEQIVNHEINSRMEQIDIPDLSDLDKRVEVLETLYLERTPDLSALRAQHTSDQGLDALAYASSVEQTLVQRQTVAQSQYLELANRRAEEIQTFLLEIKPELSTRLILSSEVSELEENSEDISILLSLEGT